MSLDKTRRAKIRLSSWFRELFHITTRNKIFLVRSISLERRGSIILVINNSRAENFYFSYDLGLNFEIVHSLDASEISKGGRGSKLKMMMCRLKEQD